MPAAPSCRRCWPTRSTSAELDALDPAHFRAEWKWDGIRVQVAASGGVKRLYSRAGEDISGAFPDIVEAIDFEGVFDGELLVRREAAVAPFNDLQQRLNRKVVTPKMLKDHPAHVRLYDVLWLDGEDLRGLPFDERRARLEAWMAETAAAALRPLAAGRRSPTGPISPGCATATHGDGIEGLMLKRADSAYLAGRPKGPWFKWKRDPLPGRLRADVRPARPRQAQLLLFRLHLRLLARDGRRQAASWRRSARPISASPTRSCAGSTNGCATTRPTASGRCARSRSELVLEIAFDGIARSTRHKSGVAMRFPRINRIRTDKPAAEADTVDNPPAAASTFAAGRRIRHGLQTCLRITIIADMIDPFGRHITYLRVSVTDRCDFRCVYCMAEDMTFLPKAEVLSLEELERLCCAFVRRGVKKLRLTGGEPLVRKNVMSLFRGLGRHLDSGALEELTLTTNGSQLAKYAARAGRHRRAGGVNVSMDTLDRDKFRQLTRWGDLDQVMRGLDAAQEAGLHIKINAVALRGVNDSEFGDLIRWSHGRGMDLVLIEVMPMGEIGGEARLDQYLPLSLARAEHRRALHAERDRLSHRRPGALLHGRGDRRAAGLHHAAHPQFLRKLQSRAADLHRHALHVPRPGGRRRPARAAARLGERRGARPGDHRGDRPQAQGPRLHHRPPPQRARPCRAT